MQYSLSQVNSDQNKNWNMALDGHTRYEQCKWNLPGPVA